MFQSFLSGGRTEGWPKPQTAIKFRIKLQTAVKPCPKPQTAIQSLRLSALYAKQQNIFQLTSQTTFKRTSRPANHIRKDPLQPQTVDFFQTTNHNKVSFKTANRNEKLPYTANHKTMSPLSTFFWESLPFLKPQHQGGSFVNLENVGRP